MGKSQEKSSLKGIHSHGGGHIWETYRGGQILNDMLQTCSRGERWGDRNHEDLFRFNEEWGR